LLNVQEKALEDYREPDLRTDFNQNKLFAPDKISNSSPFRKYSFSVNDFLPVNKLKAKEFSRRTLIRQSSLI